MTQLKITVRAEIATDNQYCDNECQYVRLARSFCQLFQADLARCLGGWPLRCNDCLAAEKGQTHE